MITNKAITIFHKGTDETTKLETWTKEYISSAWVFATKVAKTDKGYSNTNKVEVRIPMPFVKDASLFKVGDIIVIGKQEDITKQSDLAGKEFWNITSRNINDFGTRPHIHLKGE